MVRKVRKTMLAGVVVALVAPVSAQPQEPSATPAPDGPTVEASVEASAPVPAVGAIHGRVLDEHGDGVPGAWVAVAGSPGAIADENGVFTLEAVAAGARQLEVQSAGYATQVIALRVRPGATTAIEIHLAETGVPSEMIILEVTRSGEKRLDAPVTVEVVGEHDLRTAGGTSYLAALSRVKGIDFSDAGIGDQRISARGFATQFNSRMLTMVDGRLATMPGNGLPQGNLLPASRLDMKAVEVVVGPASALYGPNAHTGVINVVTKTPWDQSGAQLSMRGGGRSMLGGAARLAGTVHGDDLGWKLNGEYLRADDFAPDRAQPAHYYGTTIFEGDLVDSYKVEAAKGDATLYYRHGAWLASAGAALSDSTGVTITNGGRNQLRGWQVQTQTAQLAGEHVFAQVTRTATDAGASYQLDRLARTVAASGGIPADPVELERVRKMIAFVDDSALIDSELQLRAAPGGVRTTAGVQARRYMPSSGGTYLDDIDQEIRVSEIGGYVQADTRIVDDRVRLAAAARLDHHSLFGNEVSPKLAVQYEVAPTHNLRVGYNRAFKSPTVLENYLRISDVLLGNRTGFVIRDAGGAELGRIAPLVPEQVDAIEVGYKGAFGALVYVDAVAYQSWYRDFISPLTRVANPMAASPTFATFPDGTPVAAGTAAEGTLSTYVNFCRAQVRGADVGVDVRPLPELTLSASGSILQLVDFTNDDALQRDLKLNAPAVKLRGSVQVQDVLVEHAFVRFDGRYHGAYAFESGYWNSQTLLGGDLPARFVADVSAGFELPSQGLTFTATMSNAFDDTDPDVLGAPVPHRYAWLEVGYRYDSPGR